MKEKTENNLKIILTIIITIIVTFTVTILFLYSTNKLNLNGSIVTIGSSVNTNPIDAKINIVKTKIDSDFLNDYDENQLNEYAIKGYVAGLDDNYSTYYTKDEMKEVTEDTEGKYVGIGVYITKNKSDGRTLIYGTIENSPAEEIGLKAGDVVMAVDDYNSVENDYDVVSELLRGEEGSTIKVKVLRDNQILEFETKRKKIEIIRVKSQMINNNIAYIYISSFDGNIANQFEEKYNELVQQGATSLIIDLRNNGGGVVDEAVKIGDLFTDKNQKLLIQKDKNNNEEVTFSKKDRKITMNTVVLINGYSASASEILAAIMKDLVDNCTVIGTTTFGKGVIQSLYQFTDGSGLKLTTNEYVTPNNEKINKVGISPDIEVEYTFTKKVDLENDTQLQKAIETLNSKQ